jgi:hypothetical protein
MPKWMRKVLQIREPVREFSGTAYVGAPLDAARAADAVDLAALLEADGARPAANGS